MFFKKKNQQQEIEKDLSIPLSDIKDTFEKATDIIKEQADILCKFYKKEMMPRHSTYGKLIIFSANYDITYKGKLKLFVAFAKDDPYEYITGGHAYFDYEIIEKINIFGDEKTKKAFIILEEILNLSKNPKINIIYNDYVSEIRIITNRMQKGIIKYLPSSSKSDFKVSKNYLEPNKFYFYDEKGFFNLLKTNKDIKVTIKNLSAYNELTHLIEDYYTEKKQNIFDENNHVLYKYRNKNLKEFDLSKTDFDGKNISGLDISKNPEVHINFDKIRKDVSNCNFNGYDLSKVTFRNFNIQNTDFRNTYATIDLGSCMISYEGKMNPGTLFDENNTFMFGNKKLSTEQVKELDIKIYKKEK